MGVHEKDWLSTYAGPKVLYYRRYVDDIFCMFGEEEHATQFLSYLNNRHPNIRFTIEKEMNGQLPFLDVLITKSDLQLHTTTYIINQLIQDSSQILQVLYLCHIKLD